MRIFDIDIYRDGGSIEFFIERDGKISHVWLETPIRGEPRALLVNSIVLGHGDKQIKTLLDDIAEWWSAIPPATQAKVREVMCQEGPYRNCDDETSRAIDLSRVIHVRDYVLRTYCAEPPVAQKGP
jgi:hypothetical protein